MATALQRQLTEISAHSTHQLDLKAQKTQHAKSLLFEPSEAARQSFDDIYHLCIEGFDELCQLDARFTSFANNLFSESSKDIDRGQLTRHENEELDEAVHNFLGLAQGRLLLKPAQKSVEWLVRRYRVHEFNTDNLLLTFLPYHSNEAIFSALLAILPTDRQLPESFKWLHPYIASLSCPPRHAIVSASVTNRSFFAAFNSFVLRVAKAGHGSGIMLGFWAGITAQAVNSMLDSSRTGRDNVRKQREEDILLKVLPILQEALIISKKNRLDEMFVGACMCLTILATKASLSDAVLDAMMEAVAASCSERTINEGLTCLAVVAEEKIAISMPATVTWNLLKWDILPTLLQHSDSHRVSKLATEFAVGIIRYAVKKDDKTHLDRVKTILDADILQENDTLTLIETLVSESASEKGETVPTALTDIVSNLLNSTRFSGLAEQVARNTRVDLRRLALTHAIGFDSKAEPIHTTVMELDASSNELAKESMTKLVDFERTLNTLPALPTENYSFLTSEAANNDLFRIYSAAFQTALQAESLMNLFLDLPALGRADWVSKPNFLTFVARIWSSGNSSITTSAKVRAMMALGREVEKVIQDMRSQRSEWKTTGQVLEMHFLIPYIVAALADESRNIRSVAAETCRTMEDFFNVLKNTSYDKNQEYWERASIYGPNIPTSEVDGLWLSVADTRHLLNGIISSALEDCILDSAHIIRYLAGVLDRGSIGDPLQRKKSKGLSKDRRGTYCAFLASHAGHTPVLRTKLSLLRILAEVDKNDGVALDQFLIPSIRKWATLSTPDVLSWCESELVSVQQMDTVMLANLKRKSEEQMKLLREICAGAGREDLTRLGFVRQRQLWPALRNPELRVATVDWLLQLALGQDEGSEKVQEHALETLRALDLSPEVMIHMLKSLPTVTDLEGHPPSSKRQRRAEAERPRAIDSGKVEDAIRRITLVLELLESSMKHTPELLRPLFHLLAELRPFKLLMDSELVYLHTVLLDTLLSVVLKLSSMSINESQLGKDLIRADLLIDSVRSTSSPQIHNTALLIVSALAGLAPESVLHSVIPLFTFISSTVLRKTDEYSAHVTDHAVNRIIPALAESLKKRGTDLLSGASELLLSFVAAWEHVPLHRRLGLFETVVRAVGVEECLGVVAAMLVERYADTITSVSNFVTELMNRFDSLAMLQAAHQWLRLVFDGLHLSPKAKRQITSLSDSLLGFADKNEEEQTDSMETLIEGLADLLRNDIVRNRLSIILTMGKEEEAANIRSVYAALTEQSIQLTQRSATLDSAVKDAADGLLSASLGLLPTADFIASCAQLMQSGAPSIRQQIFQSLETRVHTSRANNTSERQVFLDVLPSCAIFVSEEQPIEVRMAAIGCIDAICEKFGKSDRDSVRSAAEKIAGPAALGATHSKLRILSLLCLASIVGVLGDGDESILIFPKVVTMALDYLTASIANQAKEIFGPSVHSGGLEDAGFRLLTSVLDHIPWIFASAVQELDRALALAAEFYEEEGAVAEFMALTTKQVPAAELFKGIERTWLKEINDLEATENHPRIFKVRTITKLLETLHKAVQHHTKVTIKKNSSTVFNLLLEGFDLRRHFADCSKDPDSTSYENLFTMVDQVALDTTRKLNDASFRPFFNRLVEWATLSLPAKDARGRTERAISLYSFALLLFESLQSLVTSYMSFLLDNAIETLHNAVNASVDKSLLELVVRLLGSSFRNAEGDFWLAPAHFDALANPLTSLLKTTNSQSRVDAEILVSTIADLAVAVATSPEQLKAINTSLLLLLRNESASVRLAAVECQRSITKKVHFDWVALLPELLPAISELQEDDDERVEHQTLLWVREIEEISGESLEGMLA